MPSAPGVSPEMVWGILLVLGGMWMALRAARFWRRRVGRRAQRRGQQCERRALKLLRSRGYRTRSVQPRARMTLLVDGEPTRFSIQADAIVESVAGEIWVVEVKTGAKAFVGHRDTRRQVLEYVLAYDARGVLLVDPDRRSVVKVERATRDRAKYDRSNA